MDPNLKNILWQQFGASIDMLENAVEACPAEVWNRESQFWYVAYHTIFYLDYYLSEEAENFTPPTPFTLSELDASGLLPERVYTKDELVAYLKFGRQKCHDLIAGLNHRTCKKTFREQLHELQ